MSDEYEYEDDERRPRRFTFGQIMLSLLLLGVVVLIGLIVLVYLTLTDTGQKINTVSPQSVSAPVRPVERFTPDGKAVAAQAPVRPLAGSEVAEQQKAADEAVSQLSNPTATQINQAALAGGAAAGALAGQARQRPPKPRVRRQQPINSAAGELTPQIRRRGSNQYTETDEVPLQPIQRGERRLTPSNRTLQSERPLTPRRTSPSNTDEQPKRVVRSNPPGEQRERPLTPTRPQSGHKSEAIEQLF